MQQKEKIDIVELRNNRIKSIKGSLSKIPIISKNTLKIEEKMKNSTQNDKGSLFTKSFDTNESLTPMTFKDIKEASLFDEKYQILEKIGEGANGFVNKCRKIATGKVYAVKSLMMDEEHIMELKQNFLAIRGLDHPNIVKYKAFYIDMRKKLCSIVMEYVDLPSLDKIKIDSQQEMKNIVYQLLQSVKYLHQKKISHRDLKPQNVLYDKQTKRIKIIDFGTAKKFLRRETQVDMLTITGTLFYRAPQMFSGGGYDEKVDIWSIGILMYWMITKKTPFESPYLSDTIYKIKDQPPCFSDDVWRLAGKGLKNLIKRMLQKDKSTRLTATECLRDVWFYSLTFEKLSQFTRSNQQFEFQIRNAQFGKKIVRKLSKKFNQPQALSHSIKKIDGQDYHMIDSDEQCGFHFRSLGDIDQYRERKKNFATTLA